MRFVKNYYFLFFLLVFGVKNSEGQKWIWAKTDKSVNFGSGSFSTGIATDRLGDVIEVGQFTDSIIFGSTLLASFETSFQGSNSIYIVKYDRNGNILWAKASNKYMFQLDYVPSVATDSAGNIYIVGSFEDSAGFCTPTIHNPVANGYFLAKFDPNGNLLWIQGSSSGGSTGECVAVDKVGNICISGYFQGALVIGSYSFSAPTLTDNVFVVKYDSQGYIIWATTSDNTNQYSISYPAQQALALDADDDIYITGIFRDTIIFGASILHSESINDLYLVKYDSGGNLQWAESALLPSANCNITNESGPGFMNLGITTDAANNVYVTGGYNDTIIFGPYSLAQSGMSGAAFLTKFSYTGNIIWAKTVTPISAFNSSFGSTLSCDKWNNIYWGGYFLGTFQYDTNTFDFSSGLNFLIKIDTGGNVICGTVVRSAPYLTSLVTSDPLTPDAFYSSVIEGIPGSAFGNDTISPGIGTDAAFIAKWACDTCKIASSILGKTFICPGQSSVLKGIGGTACTWSTGSTTNTITVCPAATTTYTLYVTNGICFGDTTITVNVNPVPVINVCCDTTIIQGQNVQLASSGGITYSWYPMNGLTCDSCAYPIANPYHTTTYYLTAESDSGCLATDSITIIVLCKPVNICCDSIITTGQSVQLISSGGNTFQWTPSIGLNCDTCPSPIATPSVSTIYTLTVISDSGCISTRTVNIDVSCGEVFIPEAFSPNNDGHNDILYVRGPCINSLDFIVFDRWGNKVFETENKDLGWDGTYKGQPMNTGTFVWYLKATMLDGKSVEKKGNVALVR